MYKWKGIKACVCFPPPAVSRGRSMEDVCLNQADDDDTHDYEYIDEDELENIRRQFNEQSISISAKAKPSNAI